MSLSDTAEYWWGVKNRRPYMGRDFTHFTNSPCGHINSSTGNTDTSDYLNDITCFACLKLINDNGNIYNLKEGISKREKKRIDKEKHKYRFGKCDCGSPMCQRKNRKTGEMFLGCLQYPKCKITRQINKPS